MHIQTKGLPSGKPFVCIWKAMLLHDVHLIDEALAVAKFVNNEEYIADIHVDTTLQVVVKVDVAAE